MSALNRDQTKQLLRFDLALATMQEATDESATLLMVRAFLSVAQNEGCSVTEFAMKIGCPRSTASRLMLSLGQQARNRGEVHGLVESRSDNTDLRLKRYYLTAKGVTVFKRILEVL